VGEFKVTNTMETIGVSGNLARVEVESSGVSATSMAFTAEVGLSTELAGNGFQLVGESDIGFTGRLDLLAGRIGTHARAKDTGGSVGIAAEVDAARLTVGYQGDRATVEVGVGIGAGAHLEVSQQDHDRDGQSELCLSVGAAILGAFHTKVCVELPNRVPAKSLPKPEACASLVLGLGGPRK